MYPKLTCFMKLLYFFKLAKYLQIVLNDLFSQIQSTCIGTHQISQFTLQKGKSAFTLTVCAAYNSFLKKELPCVNFKGFLVWLFILDCWCSLESQSSAKIPSYTDPMPEEII